MEPTLYRAPRSLRGYVECFWTLTFGEKDTLLTLKMFANGVSGIIFQQHNGRSALSRRVHTDPARHEDLPN
jgi:hypothetical protein